MTNETPLEVTQLHLDAAKVQTPEATALIAACELLLYFVKSQQIQIDHLRKHTYGG